MAHGPRLQRSFFGRDVTTVARDLLGRVLVAHTDDGDVGVRLTEVEAYAGRDDPASHAFRGPTARNAVMFGPAGHLYTYFVYGMHWCANIVTGPEGDASAVLLRAGEVVLGQDIAMDRRPAVTRTPLLARGPAGLATVLGLRRDASGEDLCAAVGRWDVVEGRAGPGGPHRRRTESRGGRGRRASAAILGHRVTVGVGLPGRRAGQATRREGGRRRVARRSREG